jgi:putative DNA primase/helicase
MNQEEKTPEEIELERSNKVQREILDALRKKKLREKKERIEAEREARQEAEREQEKDPKYVIVVPHPNKVQADKGVMVTILDIPVYADYLKEKFSTKFFKGEIYIYDDDECYYRQHTNEIGTHVQMTMDRFGILKSYPNTLREIITRLENKGSYANYPFNQSADIIPVENGVVRIDFDKGTVELLDHSPEHMNTYKLGVTYDPTASTEKIMRIFGQWVDPQKVMSLLQIPAQAILQMQVGHAFKKAHLLQGDPHAGKTTYLEMLIDFFTINNIAGERLQKICDDQFVGGNLEGKLLNVYDDLEDIALQTIDAFKTLTGSCVHNVERKYQQGYMGRITCVHVFSCNYPPEYPPKVKRDSAFWERWEYVKFPNQYPVDPYYYERTFTDEMFSSLLNAVIWAMVEMKQTGMLVKSDVQTVMHSWDINSDPLYEFITWGFREGDGKTLNKYSKEKTFQAYHKFCKSEDIPEHKRKSGINGFTRAVQPYDFIPMQQKVKGKPYEVYGTKLIANIENVGNLKVDEEKDNDTSSVTLNVGY